MIDDKARLSAAGLLLCQMNDLTDQLNEGVRPVDQIRAEAEQIRIQWRVLMDQMNEDRNRAVPSMPR
jgi:hypothetical protein